jgi:adenosine deaminase
VIIIAISIVMVYSLSTEFESVEQTGKQTPLIEEESIYVAENDIDEYFENIRNDKQKLVEFFSDMPKGGDLHNHLSGSVTTEDLIRIARDNNFCIDKSMKLNGTTPNCPSGTFPIYGVTSEDILKSWSMYEFVSSPSKSGHDHFFEIFSKFGALSEYPSSMLGYWMITAEKQKMLYMETMLNDGYSSNKVTSLADKIKIHDVNPNAFELLYDILKTDIEQIASVSSDNISSLDKQSREFCKEKSNFECDVEFTYIFQIHRTKEIHDVFVQAAMYFEIASQSNQVVGINIVSAEDNKTSMNDYDLHMKIINFLHEKYGDRVNISLHAGELSTALTGSNTTVKITVPLMEKETHILLALDTGAARIGHGVDSPYEINTYPELYSQMQNNLIAIEVPLTSNKVILQVEGKAHPIVEYMKNNVPVVLSTDDPGILRTNMTNEYVIAASTYPEFSYADFKKINRNALEFSFLPGKNLWPDPRIYENPLPECNNNKTTNCWIEGIDQKATMQNMLEEKLKEFESTVFS